ncbi:hypothetical protein ISG33_09035 [Glaciecola sp. MH2013]|uniref:CmcJ/NvfI family oxidoreductase n=1 Tax=Glaciecola sp. MH2013 TaxID=2785524 RepID=UPI00189F7BF3|nr:CmcJ/NvfI family oxidoreductase [Glaciecola sp. MH2013]MBF7073538.1 hypothetical protein [Glaciecola sp. MH2013]
MNLIASVNYHVNKNQIQSFQFDVDGIQGKLISPELQETQVQVRDIRNTKAEFSIDVDGLVFLNAKSEVNDFNKPGWKKTYDSEISQLLEKSIGAQDVLVFDHTVRIDDSEAIRKPARNVHNDYSEKAAYERLSDLVGAHQALKYKDGEFAFVNIWRPIEETIKTSPLGFIKPSSVNINDWVDIELIYPDRKGQILGLVNNPKHEWFYLSDMTPEEVIVFNIFNSKGKPHLAHSALDVVGQSKASAPRKSIETRTLVRYA